MNDRHPLGSHQRRRTTALSLVVLLAAAACAAPAASSAPPTQPPTQAPASSAGSSPSVSTQPSSAPAATPVTGTLNLGFDTPADNSHLPTMLAIQQLNAAGWQVKPTFFSAPEVEMAALAAGQVDVALGASVSVFSAIQSGAKIHAGAAEQGTAWSVVSKNAITSCDDIAGKRWALNSPSGSTTSYANYWIGNTCSADAQAKIEPIYVSGSQNRMAGMIAGQIDASLLTPFDIVNLDAQAPGKFKVLANFSSDASLKNYIANVFAVNDAFGQAHPDLVAGFLKGVQKAYAAAKSDASVVQPAAEAYKVPWDAQIQKAEELYFSQGIYDPALALTEESVNFTIQFSQKYGSIKPGLAVAQAVDLSYLGKASQLP